MLLFLGNNGKAGAVVADTLQHAFLLDAVLLEHLHLLADVIAVLLYDLERLSDAG